MTPASCGLPKYSWVIREKDAIGAEQRAWEIASKLGISQFLARTLVARGIDTVESAWEYLHPEEAELLPPESIPGLEKARDRLFAAVANGETVLIHGDYDADGICGAVILHQTLKQIGCSSKIFLPDREADGYGLAQKAIKKAEEAGIKLIITVDCGISSHETIALAREKGIEVVITDHHPIIEGIPRSEIVVHPELDGEYAGGKISGATVAFKLALSLLEGKGKETEKMEAEFLPMVAIATVADVCELTGENRNIVAKGLANFKGCATPALRVLAYGACRERGCVTERDLAFGIGPILNAAGRMGSPVTAAKLLLADSEESAWKYFRMLEEANNKRVTKLKEAFQRLRGEDEILRAREEKRIAVIVDEEGITGIAGLAASKISEETGLAVCVLSPATDEKGAIYRGSVRAPEGVDLIKLMEPTSNVAEKLGGHTGAIGITVRAEKLPEFIELCRSIRVPVEGIPNLELDFKVAAPPRGIDELEELEKTKPWGRGNPQPAFMWGPVTVKGTKVVGRESSHLQMSLHDHKGTFLKGIAFNMASEAKWEEVIGRKVAVAGHFTIDEWEGLKSMEFRILDMDFRNPS